MKKILVPCDFSDASETALNYAAGLGSFFSAGLVLLHVNQIPVMSPEIGLTPYSLADATKDSLEALEKLGKQLRAKHNFAGSIDCFSELGSVEDVIGELDKRLHVDLIVMGVSGHGSTLIKALVGSASVAVAKNTETPVLIIPPGCSFKKIDRIAYACEYDPNLEFGLPLVKVNYFNTVFGAELFIVHVVNKGHELSSKDLADDNYLERRLDNSPHRTFLLNEAKVSESLLTFIKNNHIDLVIIEPKKHSLFHKLFSESVTNALAFESPIPVLAIH